MKNQIVIGDSNPRNRVFNVNKQVAIESSIF